MRPLLTVRPERLRRVLVVDDDEDTARFHALVLRRGGLAVTVVHEVAHHFGIEEETLRELGWD